MDGEITGYNVTPDLYKKARTLGIKDVRTYIYASLRGVGFSIRNSWMIAFQGMGMNWTKDALEREMNKLEALESVQKRIEEIQKSSNSEDISPEELAKATSKEQILKNLVIAQRKQKLGSPEWQKIVAMIGDFTRIKQDELQTEDTTVHFFLPANYPTCCRDCLLFKNGKADFQTQKR